MFRSTSPELREALQHVADRISSVVRLDGLLHRPGTGETIDVAEYLDALTQDIGAALAGRASVWCCRSAAAARTVRIRMA